MSRTPIREALKLLEADGLIEITLHRGAIVSEYRPEEAFLLFDVIALLESLAARRVCENITAETLQRLEDFHGEMLDHHRAGRTNDYFDINTIIHDYIVESSSNSVLIATHERLMIRARRGRFLAILNPDRLTQAVSEHEDLMPFVTWTPMQPHVFGKHICATPERQLLMYLGIKLILRSIFSGSR